MAYQVALTQVAFNRYYENAIRFDTRVQQETFFRVDDLFANAPTVNLLKGNFFNLEIPWKVTGDNLCEMESYNYCIIKETISNNTKYYYYFITNMRYDQSNQFILSLELDIINTYYIDAVFSDGLINRAHLNRWKFYIVDGLALGVTFNNDPDSLMLIPDSQVPLSKYCLTREQLRFKYEGFTEEVRTWLNDNVMAWEYIFLQAKQPYKYYTCEETEVTQTLPRPEFWVNPIAQNNPNAYNIDDFYTVIVQPIYKDYKYIYSMGNSGSNTHKFFYGNRDGKNSGEVGFRNKNNDSAYYLAKIVSKIPPFTDNLLNAMTIDGDGNLKIPTLSGSSDYLGNGTARGIVTKQYDSNVGYGSAMFISGNIATEQPMYPFNLDIQTTFLFQEFRDADYDPKFNPKLLGSNYMSLKLVNDAGISYDYDIQKSNTKSFEFVYTERPQPNVTRSYTRLNVLRGGDQYGIYTPATRQNLTGLVSAQDCNVCFSTDSLANYLASNRNFMTQTVAKIGVENINSQLNSASQAMATYVGYGTKAGAAAGIAGGTSALTATLSMLFNLYNTYATVDNMRNAPDLIRNANGDIIFNMTYNDIALYAEHHIALDCELKREAERMNLFGYYYNRIGNVKSVDNIRKYFNFVQAVIETVMYKDIDNVYKPVPNIVLNKFKDVFSKGVRFWNYTGGKFVDYSKENYETFLIPYVEI